MKMKKTVKSIAVAIAAVVSSVVVSCSGGGGSAAGDFAEAEDLRADSIAINEIIQPNNILLRDGYAVISSPKNKKVLFRYSLPGWEITDTSLTRGEGPGDLNDAVLLKQNRKDDTLWISEPNKRMLLKAVMNPGGISVEEEIRLQGYDLWLWNSAFVVDGKSIVNIKLDFWDTEETKVYSYDMTDSMAVRDSVLCLTRAYIEKHDDGKSKWASATISNSPEIQIVGDRMAIWYPDTRNTMIYRIGADGRFVLEKTFGAPLTYEQVKNMDFKNIKRDEAENFVSADEDYLYFKYVKTKKVEDNTEDNAGGPSGNAPKPEKRENVALELRVYDWDMNPVKKFTLDKVNGTSLFIDRANGKVYSYDRSLDFEYVYVYDFKI